MVGAVVVGWRGEGRGEEPIGADEEGGLGDAGGQSEWRGQLFLGSAGAGVGDDWAEYGCVEGGAAEGRGRERGV